MHPHKSQYASFFVSGIRFSQRTHISSLLFASTVFFLNSQFHQPTIMCFISIKIFITKIQLHNDYLHWLLFSLLSMSNPSHILPLAKKKSFLLYLYICSNCRLVQIVFLYIIRIFRILPTVFQPMYSLYYKRFVTIQFCLNFLLFLVVSNHVLHIIF